MHYYEVAPNQIFRLDSNYLTYSSPVTIKVGSIVRIEIGNKKSLGVITRQVEKPSYKTKSIIETFEEAKIPTESIELAKWMSSYYITPLPTVLQLFFPRSIFKKTRLAHESPAIITRKRTNILFNKDQKLVISQLSKNTSGTFLLNGVTGSGKTEIYIDTAKKTINQGKSVIILVPEIALTPQLISEFSNHFSNLITTHSGMTDSYRRSVWKQAANSQSPAVVIGPRSALFLPVNNLGLIVIDEAHEPSYKQESSPKYLTLRVATILGRLHKAKVIFGSATPNVIDTYIAEQTNKILYLKTPAVKNSSPINTILVDMKDRKNFSKHRFLSNQLLEQIDSTLKNHRQILLFHNRRGSASQTICHDCGWVPTCPNCHIPLSLHSDKHILLCHICNYTDHVPTMCPVCNGVNIIHKGIGTKLIESEISKIFPKSRIFRLDSDNTAQKSMNEVYGKLYNGEIDILIGTQSIAKGLDLPKLETVGVIQADAGLIIPDYTTTERTYQLIAQVVGRVGRNNNPANVILQTYQPSHPSIVYGLKQDYSNFYHATIKDRQKNLFPPFTHLLQLTCQYKTENAAIKNSTLLFNKLKDTLPNGVKILRPTPRFYERTNGDYKWHIVLKSPKRDLLTKAIKYIPKNNWQFEIDPTSLL